MTELDLGLAHAIFWGSAALIVYTYAIFPLLVLLRGILAPRPHRSDPNHTPTVSMIIAAYNEEEDIGPKLENVASLDYPADQLEVIVASDGSTDRTVEIARRFHKAGIRVLDLPRQGKAKALNTAVEASSGEILVFSDASSMYARDAIRELVAPMADPTVGGVAGDRTYLETGLQTNSGEKLYWSFDQRLKQLQSQAGNAIGASGAIYSIRRSLFRPVPEGVTDDFVTSTAVIVQGYRLLFNPRALAYEPPARTSGDEFNRKVRVMTRGLQGVLSMRTLLNPFRYGFYSLQLLSHKVLRRLMVFPLLTLFVSNVALWPLEFPYQALLLAQIAFYLCAAVAILLPQSRLAEQRVVSLPFFFCMVNAAALLASWNIVRGRRVTRWNPVR